MFYLFTKKQAVKEENKVPRSNEFHNSSSKMLRCIKHVVLVGRTKHKHLMQKPLKKTQDVQTLIKQELLKCILEKQVTRTNMS